MGDSTDSEGIRWWADSSNGSWISSDSWQQKNIFLSVAQSMWRKRRKSIFCFATLLFVGVCRQRGWNVHAYTIRVTGNIPPWESARYLERGSICLTFILGLVYSTAWATNLSVIASVAAFTCVSTVSESVLSLAGKLVHRVLLKFY